MRIVKDATERKNEILDAAEELFAAKGYEQTSTGDILGRVGIARGTLYYHFKSKEDILDALIERINGVLIAGAKKAAADQSIPVVERIVRTIMSMKVDSGEDTIGHEVIQQVHKPQNALMWHREYFRWLDTWLKPGSEAAKAYKLQQDSIAKIKAEETKGEPTPMPKKQENLHITNPDLAK